MSESAEDRQLSEQTAVGVVVALFFGIPLLYFIGPGAALLASLLAGLAGMRWVYPRLRP